MRVEIERVAMGIVCWSTIWFSGPSLPLRMIAGMATGRDLAHVPNDGALRIEVGGAHQQNAPHAIFGGDRGQKLAIDILVDQGHERLVVGERRTAEQARQNEGGCNLGRLISGPDLLQLAVVAGPPNMRTAR